MHVCVRQLQSLFDKERREKNSLENELKGVLKERDELLLRIKALERSMQGQIDAIREKVCHPTIPTFFTWEQ